MQEIDLQIIIENFKKCKNLTELQTSYNQVLGSNGSVTNQLKSLKNLSVEEKKTLGPQLNSLKNQINQHFHERREQLEIIDEDDSYFDMTTPSREQDFGSKHIIHESIEQIANILHKMGFAQTQTTEIEDELHNFELLNTPALHPARQMQDTFYLQKNFDTDNKTLLRTHTSGAQIRAMLDQTINRNPPVAIISTGKVFRKDWDATHTPMFHQIEGFMIDQDISLANMKWCLSRFLQEFFDNTKLQIRFRMSYFPFTEPSCEIDISSDRGKHWLEILGCGMIHRNVLKNMNLDYQKQQGFAFGMGVERLAMLKHNITDLRSFYKINLTKEYYKKCFLF